MKKIIFILTIFLSINVYSYFKNCHLYLDLEKEKGCWFKEDDSSNYLVGYGYKYCSTFENKNRQWNGPIKDFVIKTRECLKSFITKEDKLSCSKLEYAAFDSHPHCYRKSGFCELNFKDQSRIILTAMELDVLLKFKKSIKQAFIMLNDCISNKPKVQKIFSLYNSTSNIVKQYPLLKPKISKILSLDNVSENNIEKYIDYAQSNLLNENKSESLNKIIEFKEKLKNR